MPSSREQPVACLSELPPAPSLHAAEVDGTKILLARLASPPGENRLVAVGAQCPHAQAPLVEGALCGTRLVCPWHQGVFDLAREGALLEPPPLDGLPHYPVRVADDGTVFVTLPETDTNKEPAAAPANFVPRRERTIAVVGAGPAGEAAAEALRAEGFDGRVVLIGREDRAPYDRTILSKHLLSGQAGPEKLPLRPEGDAFYARHGIERRVGTVTRLDAPARTLTFADGSTLFYDGALLATGSVPRPLAGVPGADLPGVCLLRNVEDCERLIGLAGKEGDGGGKRAVVIGASFIGLEAASCLRQRGVEVTVVAPTEVPFEKQFGRKVGEALRALHESHGVRFRLGTEVERIEASGSDRGATKTVCLKNGGERLPADFVLVGVGVRPATDFVVGVEKDAEDGGVVVDEHLHAGNNLYAAGDLAHFPLSLPPGTAGERVRVEHWRVAEQHGRLAARNLAFALADDGSSTKTTVADHGLVPFFWTFHYDQRWNYVGHANASGKDDEVILDGDPAPQGGPFLAYYLRDGRTRAVLGRRRDADVAALHELLRLGRAPTAEQLRSTGGDGGKPFQPREALASAAASR